MQLKANSLKTLAATALLSVGLGLGVATTVEAKTTTLVAGTWMPPSNPMNTIVWPTWAKWVEEATEGRVQVKIEHDLGDPKTYYDLVEDGAIQAGWSFHGYLPGRFALPQAVELPGMGANVNAEAASWAMWQVSEKYFAKANEHDGLEVIAHVTHGPGQIHSRRPISSFNDLINKRIRVGGGVQSELAKRMNITPVAASGPQVYELLQQGVIDGVFMPAQEQASLKLDEVAPNLTLLPGGMYLGSFSMFIDPEFMASISKKDADAIRSVSGAKLSALAGRAWDMADQEGLDYAKAKGVNIVELSANDAMAKEFKELIKGMDDNWVKSVANRKVDAKKALAELRELARNYKPLDLDI